MIESTVSQRRGLDSERQTKENEEQRRTREVRSVHASPSHSINGVVSGNCREARSSAVGDIVCTEAILLRAMR